MEKNVRYCPIIIKFASYLKAKAGNAAYSFLADVYTLPSIRTIDSYSTLDSNSEDGVLYETLNDCERLLNIILASRPNATKNEKEWARMVILKFDEMKVKKKICYNFHTHEIVGFEEGALNIDVLKKEFNALHQNVDEDEDSQKIPPVAKHILLFMMRRWDKVGDPMKRSIARFSVDSSNREDIKRKNNECDPCAIHLRDNCESDS